MIKKRKLQNFSFENSLDRAEWKEKDANETRELKSQGKHGYSEEPEEDT